MRRGDGVAAFRLLQRRRALQGIAKRGGHWRVQLMNRARLVKRRLQKRERESEAMRIAALQECKRGNEM
jgi:hypothetical protein